MSDFDYLADLWDGMVKLFVFLMVCCLIFVPLGIWKIVELVMEFLK
jgi:hypothetical protein